MNEFSAGRIELDKVVLKKLMQRKAVQRSGDEVALETIAIISNLKSFIISPVAHKLWIKHLEAIPSSSPVARQAAGLIREFQSDSNQMIDLATLYDVDLMLDEKLEGVDDLLQGVIPPRFTETVSAVVGCLAMWAENLRRKRDLHANVAVWAVIHRYPWVFQMQRVSLGLPTFRPNTFTPVEAQIRQFFEVNGPANPFKRFYYTLKEADVVNKLSAYLEIVRALAELNGTIDSFVQAVIEEMLSA